MATFKKGDKVRENRQGAQTETVIRVEGTTLFTDKGTLHTTKAVLVKPGLDNKLAKDANIPLPKNVTTNRQALEFLAEPSEKSGLQQAFKEWEAWQSAPAAKAKAPSKASRDLIKKIASRNSKVASSVAGLLMQMGNKYN